MARMSTQQFVPWANYHLTSGTRYQLNSDNEIEPMLEPLVPVELLAKFHCSDLAEIDDPSRCARMTELVFEYLVEFEKLYKHRKNRHDMSENPNKGEFKQFPTVQIGSGWSFSGLIGADDGKKREAVLDCSGLAGCLMLDDSYRLGDTSAPVALAGGGTVLQELADWAATHEKSIMTSGTHMGMTIAGGIATASHGSRLGFGGIQNMIAGVLLVIGKTEAVWVEPESSPLLNEAALAAMASDKLTNKEDGRLKCIHDDGIFNDVLVHLGCMGIVAAVAVRLVPDDLFEVRKLTQAIDSGWLDRLATRDWSGIADELGHHGRSPAFYELTVDPHAWQDEPAAHTLYFKAPPGSVATVPAERRVGPGDAIALMATRLGKDSFQLPDSAVPITIPAVPADEPDNDLQPSPPLGYEVPMILFDPDGDQTDYATTVYDHYLRIAEFPSPPTPKINTWRMLHRDAITGGYPGALYNASWAVPLASLPQVLPAITAAVRQFPRSFVFTLRFVSNPAGTMAFTRWPETCVIEIDGLSPWIARKVANRMKIDHQMTDEYHAILQYVAGSIPRATQAVCEALVASVGDDWSMHFAKRGFIDRRKVQRDFAAPLARWRHTRETLLTDFGQNHFWNWGAINMGLIERP